jgi:predicted XRE-type DNA-binding protein
MKEQTTNRQGCACRKGSGNVYADLGYSHSESMLVKAQLATTIAKTVQRRPLTQHRSAEILGLAQPTVAAIPKGQFRGISEPRLSE